jgi:hypothetical protein
MRTADEIQAAARVVAALIEANEAAGADDGWNGLHSDNPYLDCGYEVKITPWYVTVDRGPEHVGDDIEITDVYIEDYESWDPASVMLLEAAVRKLL